MLCKEKTSLLLLVCLAAIFAPNGAQAGLLKRSSRMVREVYPEIEPESDGNQAQVCIVGDVVYGIDEPVPAEQPCLKCRCQPPGVHCETIRCTKKPGCRAIHKPNKCCPDYQCECQHEGKTYANGERLQTPPGGECKVCYCRGGEVQCAEVSCYIRSDCEAKTVPGQCCPKYDHCPPKEPLILERSSDLQSIPEINQKELELYPITAISLNLTTETTTPIYDNNQTKNRISETKNENITIQEIIPEIKEYPITAPTKPENQVQDQLAVESIENQNGIVVTDAQSDFSEVTEIFQHPPPVLRIGDKLLFLKKGELVPEKDASTPTSVITLIGAEGLQRGFEDSGEVDSNQTIIADNDLELNQSASTHILSLLNNKNASGDLELVTIGLGEVDPSDTTVSNDQLDIFDTTTTQKSNLGEPTEDVTETSTIPPISTTTNSISDDYNTTDDLADSTTNLEIDNQSYSTSSIFELSTTEVINDLSTSSSSKILPGVLQIRNNKTIPQNTTNEEWLKSGDSLIGSLVNLNATLPDYILNQTAPTDFINNNDTEYFIDSTTTEEFLLPTTTMVTKIVESVQKIKQNENEAVNSADFEQNSTNFRTNSTESNGTKYLENHNGNIDNSKEKVDDQSKNLDEIIKPSVIIPGLNENSKNETSRENLEDAQKFAKKEQDAVNFEQNSKDLKDENVDAISIKSEENHEENIDKSNESNGSENEEINKSVETLEELNMDSGEAITPKSVNRAILTNSSENASVEKFYNENYEPFDMLAIDTKKLDISSNNTYIIDDDVEVINKTSSEISTPKDVEIIEAPNPIKSNKIIGKRENSKEVEDEEVFKQLNDELNTNGNIKILNNEEEKKKSDRIFEELLDETSTPKNKVEEKKSDEAEALQKVSDALAKYSLRGREGGLDGNILRILTEFFNNQMKYYNTKQE